MVIIQFKSRSGSYEERPHYVYMKKIMKARKIIVIDFEKSDNYEVKLKDINKKEKIYIETTYKEQIIIVKEILKNNDNIYIKQNWKMIELFNNKYDCYCFLDKKGFKQQETYKLKENKLSFPFVLKTIDGNKGEEVFKIINKEDMDKIIIKFPKEKLITQKYNDKNIGIDIRIMIFDDNIYFYKRIGKKGSFKSNIAGGGHIEELKELPMGYIEKINKLKLDLKSEYGFDFKEDYFALDVFDDNQFNIIEMNYNPTILVEIEKICPGLEKTIGNMF